MESRYGELPSPELRRKIHFLYLADTHWDQFGADDPSEEA
jgi:hypothetical protein